MNPILKTQPSMSERSGDGPHPAHSAPVLSILEALEQEIELQQQVQGFLAEKLACLIPNAPEAAERTNQAPKPQEVLSPIGDRLRSILSRLYMIRLNYENIVKRLEV